MYYICMNVVIVRKNKIQTLSIFTYKLYAMNYTF